MLSIYIGITRFAVEMKICSITARVKKYKWIIKETKGKIDDMEVLISWALVDSYISYNEFVLVNNVNMMIWEKKSKL